MQLLTTGDPLIQAYFQSSLLQGAPKNVAAEDRGSLNGVTLKYRFDLYRFDK